MFDGTIRIDEDRPDDSVVEVEIDASSIDTREQRRDEHLRSADFFDVAAYPVITFRSTRVEPVSPVRHDHWLVAGDLTIHGVTRSVKLAVEWIDDGQKAWPPGNIAFAATTMISRKAFGVGPTPPLDGGGLLIADDVRIAFDIQALKGAVTGR
jgi:polyisoprenoid-binding protein YceI